LPRPSLIGLMGEPLLHPQRGSQHPESWPSQRPRWSLSQPLPLYLAEETRHSPQGHLVPKRPVVSPGSSRATVPSKPGWRIPLGQISLRSLERSVRRSL
jgi:hypothetical protein